MRGFCGKPVLQGDPSADLSGRIQEIISKSPERKNHL